jgi:hypothetical protein
MFTKLLIIISFLFISNATFSQYKINVTLKKQLDSVMVMDQKYREVLTHLIDSSTAESKHYWGLQHRIDSLNVIFIEKVFKKFGYPGKTLVGEPTNETAWAVIQHSKKISKYLKIFKAAAQHKELPFHLYAMMLDRDLCDHNKEQIYGSQAVCMALKNKGRECFIWPIKDPKLVNKLRKDAGFDLTVEENATRLDIDYRVVKLSEIQGLK